MNIPENGKLCILRLSAIGDVCHAVAMVQRIQSTRPDIEITWIIGKVEHLLVGDIPNINFVIFDKKQGLNAYKDLRKALKGKKFDVLFAMQVAMRANLAIKLINANTVIGFDKSRAKELHSVFIDVPIATQHQPHVLDGFMAFADAVNIPKQEKIAWHIPLSNSETQVANQLKTDLGRYVVLCPAASKAERNWTVDGYAKIADYIANCGFSVVICGGPTDMEKQLSSAIMDASEVKITNMVAKTSLKELLAILQNAELVIAPDTGPAHMATSVGTAVIGLYAHSNPLRTGPYNDLNHVVSVYDEAIQLQHHKPWQDLPWGKRAKGEHLMQQITLERVTTQINSVLEIGNIS